MGTQLHPWILCCVNVITNENPIGNNIFYDHSMTMNSYFPSFIFSVLRNGISGDAKTFVGSKPTPAAATTKSSNPKPSVSGPRSTVSWGSR